MNPASVEAAKTRPHAHPLPGESGPDPRPEIVTAKPPAEETPSTDSDVARAMAEADPQRALNLSGSLRLSKRAHLEPQPHAGPVILKSEPVASALPSIAPPSQAETPAQAAAAIESGENAWKETSFIVPPGNISPATAPSTGTINVRRKAKLTDVARIIVPPKPAEPEPSAPKGEASATVIPPAFTVAMPTGNVMAPTAAENPEPPKISTASPEVVQEKASSDTPEKKRASAETQKITFPDLTRTPNPAVAEKPRNFSPEPEAQKAAPSAASISIQSAVATPGASEKKEFLLTNGERILGCVLSETAETIYLDHGTLGVLTLPRGQIAQRPVEIILINGDRIVGDIMAETPDTLYVRHASLGMLTVPRAQRSTRVVEAILKDGDRILGEVLAETETFTVIRSATLGTVTVPHDKVTMLNRKIEQIELKALPPAAPELEDKTAK
jgi:RNase P/RNase MRP subunit p29